MDKPSYGDVLLGFGVFVVYCLIQLWAAKHGHLGKGIQKYFNDSDRKKS